MTTNTSTVLSRGKADTLAGIVEQRGWEKDPEHTRLSALRAAAQKIATAVDQTPAEMPRTARDVEGWVRKAAEAATLTVARREAAARLEQLANQELSGLVAPLARTIVPRLADEFAEHLTGYLAQSTAPRTITGHETAEQLAAHATLLRCAEALSIDLTHRATVADKVGEGEDIGTDVIWLALSPTKDTSIDALTAALSTFRGTIPRTVDDWDALIPLGLGLAGLGEVPDRKERLSSALYQRGMVTPDGGMFDRTFGEVESARMHPNVAAMAAGQRQSFQQGDQYLEPSTSTV